MKAIWQQKILAQSEDTVVVENNHYFPVESCDMRYFKKSASKTICPWKGEASYYELNVAGKTNKDAAWYYPSPKPEAQPIKGRVAFWHGVEIVE